VSGAKTSSSLSTAEFIAARTAFPVQRVRDVLERGSRMAPEASRCRRPEALVQAGRRRRGGGGPPGGAETSLSRRRAAFHEHNRPRLRPGSLCNSPVLTVGRSGPRPSYRRDGISVSQFRLSPISRKRSVPSPLISSGQRVSSNNRSYSASAGVSVVPASAAIRTWRGWFERCRAGTTGVQGPTPLQVAGSPLRPRHALAWMAS